ncbi:hypothetical protein FALBO_16500 [Fusarium albosuccineum]|uniref:NmrA-like domain-containing protein n=1 Tax=Fusarium albosuccineum TaxID=1237068 RepID=A0A8H4KH67_9HYPO|nr:hypothetical protein FALBO_16500 [Fusarium albosuccineum]
MQIMTETASVAQVNLVKAAVKSGTVKRFVVSEWCVLHTEISPAYTLREAAVEELRNTGLQWTRFAVGYFMDYYGMPHVKSHLTPVSFVVDVKNKAAAIPGTGDNVVSFIYSSDMAKFVVAALSSSRWEETTYSYGDKATFNQIIDLAERARGAKFDVAHDSVDKLSKGEITELPSHKDNYAIIPKGAFQRLSAVFATWVVSGHFDIPAEKSPNVKFPEIKTRKLTDVVGMWKGH